MDLASRTHPLRPTNPRAQQPAHARRRAHPRRDVRRASLADRDRRFRVLDEPSDKPRLRARERGVDLGEVESTYFYDAQDLTKPSSKQREKEMY